LAFDLTLAVAASQPEMEEIGKRLRRESVTS